MTEKLIDDRAASGQGGGATTVNSEVHCLVLIDRFRRLTAPSRTEEVLVPGVLGQGHRGTCGESRQAEPEYIAHLHPVSLRVVNMRFSDPNHSETDYFARSITSLTCSKGRHG